MFSFLEMLKYVIDIAIKRTKPSGLTGVATRWLQVSCGVRQFGLRLGLLFNSSVIMLFSSFLGKFTYVGSLGRIGSVLAVAVFLLDPRYQEL